MRREYFRPLAASIGLLGVLPLATAAAAEGDAARDGLRPSKVERGSRRSVGPDGVPLYTKVIFSPVYRIDRIYKSMMGPQSTHGLVLDRWRDPELLWVVGLESSIRGPDGSTHLSDGFMCHTNLGVEIGERDRHRLRFPTELDWSTGRLFTLAQGQVSVQLPPGFGIPLMSNQNMLLATQVLNHNIEDRSIDVRHRVVVTYHRDAELSEPLKPLIPLGIQALKVVDGPDGHFGISSEAVDSEVHGEGCGFGQAKLASEAFDDGHGRRFTGFWVVEPGREVNHTRVTDALGLPYDTRAHFIAVHLHPFAESLKLYDRTAGETVFESRARNAREGVGLAEVEYYASAEGLSLFRNHEYELISTYDNSSGVDQDAMATMILYVHARDLDESTLRRSFAARSPARVSGSRAPAR